MAYLKVLIVASIVSIPIVASIKCFVCNSMVDERCLDVKQNDTNSNLVVDCSTEVHEGYEPFCRKNRFEILGEHTTKRIFRSCGWIAYKGRNDSCINGNTDFKRERSCQCFTDYCNGASFAVPNSFFFVITLLVFFMGRFF